jgi:ligand-binding sensor domain-containing protein
LKAQPQWVIYNTSNSGLPSNEVNGIAFDSSNIKWITTSNGLVKYNGNTWIVYDTTNSGLTGNFVWQIAIDYNNIKWFNIFQKGLMKYDGFNWIFYDTVLNNNALTSIRDISVDNYNNKWIATSTYGLFRFNNSSWTVFNTTNSGIPTNNLSCLSLNGNTKWMGTYYYGIARYNDSNWVNYNETNSGIPSNWVLSVYADREHNIWVGTYLSGAAKFIPSSNIWIYYNTGWPGFPNNDIRKIYVDSNNVKWFGSVAWLAKFDDVTLTIFDTLWDPSIQDFKNDKYHNLWISYNQGLAIYNQTGVVPVKNENYITVSDYSLYQNYPNPFNSSTKIKFSSKKSGNIKISIYNILGKKIIEYIKTISQPGIYDIILNMKDYSSGVYFYSLTAEDKIIATKQLILIK